MKKNAVTWVFSSVVLWGLISACASHFAEDHVVRDPASSSNAGDLLRFSTTFDVSASKGTTYLAFMQQTVKPALDGYATKGFKVAPAAAVEAALANVDDKVRWSVLKDSGNQRGLTDLVDALNKQDKFVTVYTLPTTIASTSFRGNRYSLSTFLALASGGGVAVKLDDKNIFYNVNYGTGKQAKDEMTGRSFGAGPAHKAGDASDKFYLQELEDYVRAAQDPSEFYRSLMHVLTNNDPSNYPKISADGQTVLTDFFTIYTAEQDRHLMANLTTHAWDVSLLEVTLLGAFHSGQKKIMVMFNGNLTDSVPKQAPGGEPRNEMKPASLIDWWQFSSNPDPASKNRSGINVTKKDFRRLGQAISNYERKNHPDLVAKVEKHFHGVKPGGNVFAELSDELINLKTPKSLGQDAYALADDFTEFLMQVRKDANEINAFTIAGGGITQ